MHCLHVVPAGITLTEIPFVDSSAFCATKKMGENTLQTKAALYSGTAVTTHVDPRMEHLLYEKTLRDLGL